MNAEKINAWIDRNSEELIGFFQTILRIPSVTGNEGPIQEYLKGYLEDMGQSVDFFVPSLDDSGRIRRSSRSRRATINPPNVVATYKGAGAAGGRCSSTDISM